LAFASNCFAVDDSSVDRAGLRYDPALLANPSRKGGVASATAAYTVASEIAEGDALLSYGGDICADLIVAGGYGRSRLRKLAFCHALVVEAATAICVPARGLMARTVTEQWQCIVNRARGFPLALPPDQHVLPHGRKVAGIGHNQDRPA
jgi:hypothetical protein